MTGAVSLRSRFEAGEYAVDGSQPCGDRHCTVLRATGSDRFENFSARALGHESGVVHQFHASNADPDDGTGTLEYHLVLDRLGDVTVSRPA